MRLKVSLETAFWLQTGAHRVLAHFHQPGGTSKDKFNPDD